jgi:hypothetical protein
MYCRVRKRYIYIHMWITWGKVHGHREGQRIQDRAAITVRERGYRGVSHQLLEHSLFR